jgi:hypothetical protein
MWFFLIVKPGRTGMLGGLGADLDRDPSHSGQKAPGAIRCTHVWPVSYR